MKIDKWAFISLVIAPIAALGLLYSNLANAATVTNQITCSAPTTRADGSAFNAASELDHYTLYRSACGGTSLTKVKDFGPDCATADSIAMTTAACALQYSITATDTTGLESAQSAAVQVTDTLSPPAPPGNLTIVTHSGN